MSFHPKQLATFLAIVQCGSIGRAAQELGLTQPAVSRNISRLEQELGVALFERLPTGMALSVFGKSFRPYAELLSAEANNAVEAINSLRGLKSGELRVGAIGSVVSWVLPKAIQKLHAAHPELTIKVIEAIDDRLIQALVAGDIDLAIVVTPLQDERIALVQECVYGDIFRLIARSGHPLHQQTHVALADLVKYPWVSPPASSSVAIRTADVFRAHGLELPRPSVETRSITALRAILLHTDFVTCIPDTLVKTELGAGLIKPFDFQSDHWRRNLYLFRRRRGLLPPPALAFLSVLQEIDFIR